MKAYSYTVDVHEPSTGNYCGNPDRRSDTIAGVRSLAHHAGDDRRSLVIWGWDSRQAKWTEVKKEIPRSIGADQGKSEKDV